MLKLATLFHLNLMYSAIPAARRAAEIHPVYLSVVPGDDPWHVSWSLTITAEDLGLDDA